MSRLVWNCHGLGNLVTEKELGDLTRAKDSSIVFIVETWTDEARLEKIKQRLHFDHMFFVPRIHRGGGLMLYWKETMNLKVETSSKNHIDCIIIGKGSEGAWRFIGFYDGFNEISRGVEKKGGSNRGHAQMQLFRDVVDECGFIDMNGQVVASTAETFPLPFSMIAVEVIVATKALCFANDLGLPTIVLEGDSKITIDALAGEDSSLTEYGHLVDEAKELAKDFTYIEFSHVLRQKNSVVHNIARHARHVREYSVRMEDIPLHLFSVIQADSVYV